MSTIKINSERCKGCGLCISVCSKKCISFSEQFSNVGYHRVAVLEKKNTCVGCGCCYSMCPDVCIEVYG
ncbi:MAG: 4Fe-4S binding protein [Endomicrobium sp.]|jgi:2-oxoglutarate ferredoxin oxidoreductase subunit delta|nr:4Fe-4S binding protein [Endomicrobium sp.]